MSDENTDNTVVQEVDIDNLEDLLGTGADSVMTPDEPKRTVFAPVSADTSFLDKPPVEDGNEKPPAEPAKEEEPPAEPSAEPVDDGSDPLAPPSDDTEPEEPKNKGGRPTNLASVAKSLIEKKMLLPFDDDKKIEEYTASDFEELIEANMQNMQNKLQEELPAHFFQNMPPEMQQAYKYIADGGQDLKGLFQAMSASQEVRDINIQTEAGQVYAIRSYLQATNYGTPEEIEEEINAYKDRDELGKKANQFKPKLDAMQQNIVQQRLAAQEQRNQQRQRESQMYMESVYNTLEPGKLNGMPIDNRTQNMLYAGLVQPNYPSINGKQTNLLGHLLEKYQWVEPRHDLIAEALYLLADPEGYRDTVRTQAKQEQTEETVRALKTEESNKLGSSVTDDKDDGGSMPTKQGIQRPKKNFFAR